MNFSKKVFDGIIDYLVITLGSFIYAISWSKIFIPNGIASGGITGLCTIIQYGTGFHVSISYGIINVVLLILAFIILGRSFGIKTIYTILAISFFLEIVPRMEWLPALYLKEMLLVPIIAAIIEAVGVALVLNRGASTGGTDIIALILGKYWTISIGTVYRVMDAAILCSLLLLPGRTIDDVVIGYMAVMVFTYALDYIVLGQKSSVQLIIFSEKYTEIADTINNKLHRGVTALHAQGWYSKSEKKVLMVLIRRNQLSEFKDMVKSVDPKAFVTVTSVAGVYGEGFEEMKKDRKPSKLFASEEGLSSKDVPK